MEHDAVAQVAPGAPKLPEYADESYEARWVSEMSIEAYHAERGHINSGGLRDVLRSPYHYYQALRGNEPDQTDSMVLGSLIHAAILEPVRFSTQMIRRPEFNRRTNQGKADEAEWMKRHEGRIIVDDRQAEVIEGVLDSISRMPELVGLLTDGHKEISGFFRDPETGLKCRIRPDMLIAADTVSAIPPYIIDVKTTRDASEEAFERSIIQYGYHIAAAYYLHGASIISGQTIRNFQWIAVENHPPYAVAVYEMDQAWAEIGEFLYRRAIRRLKKCIDRDEWPSYQLEPKFISPPSWYMKKFETMYDMEEVADGGADSSGD